MTDPSRTYTVTGVTTAINGVVQREMSRLMWVKGQVSSFRDRSGGSGALYFELVDTDHRGQVSAMLPVNAKPSTARAIARRMAAAGAPLANEVQIRVRGRLRYWAPRGRLSLELVDVDPAHTAGALALARRRLLEELHAEDLIEANAALPTPTLPLRLGVVTSPDSQAQHDLFDELARSRLPFQVLLAPSLVQGAAAPASLRRALERLRAHAPDLVLMTRGGGAESDLLAFDDGALARAVAGYPIPVWTGIGHHLDSPVAEQVAARALKTPTALAAEVVLAVRTTTDRTEARWQDIRSAAGEALTAATGRLREAAIRARAARSVPAATRRQLSSVEQRLGAAGRTACSRAALALDVTDQRLQRAVTTQLAASRARLDAAENLLNGLDPAALLDRGWSITTDDDGLLVDGPRPAGTVLRTRTRGGELRSVVTS